MSVDKRFSVLKMISKSVVALSLTAFLGCSGGSGGGSSSGGSSSTYGSYTSPSITANQFINALNDADGAPSYDESEIVLYTDETDRSTIIGEDDWFVIYDAKYDEYKAVSLQYVRSIVYFDYFSNNFAAADEFRAIESDDVFNGLFNGDLFGDDYEVVDLDIDGFFYGRESGFAYEDESESTDVNLLTGEVEKKKFFQQAANLSYTYSVSLETAMSLVSLGTKVNDLMTKSNQQLTYEDELALLGDLEDLTGASLSDVLEASQDPQKKSDLLKSVSKKVGTTAQKLEDQILPELFGLAI